MPFKTKRQDIRLSADEKQRLESLRRSRSEETPGGCTGILLDLASGRTDAATARSKRGEPAHGRVVGRASSCSSGWRRR
jgi:hypothetical protein